MQNRGASADHSARGRRLGDKKPDRRVRRTRELLRTALLALIVERGYERVTVQDILDRADVGRSTFYAHFRDKEDLLLSGFEELRPAFESDGQHAALADPGKPTRWPSLAVFEHAARSRLQYKALVGKRGAEIVRKRLHQLISHHLRTHLQSSAPEAGTRVPLDAVVEFAASALVGLTGWWIENDLPYSPDEMDAIYRQLIGPGVRSGLRPSA